MATKLNTEIYSVEDVSRRVAKATGFAKADTDEICREFAHQLVEITKEGKSFKIPEFFKTSFVIRPEKRVPNPRTGEMMTNPPMVQFQVKVFDTIRREVRERHAGLLKQNVHS